jgi:hypothetical protein
MQKTFGIKIFIFTLVLLEAITFASFNVNKVNATVGVCGDIILLKNGAVTSSNSSFSIPDKTTDKWQLKFTTDHNRAGCLDKFGEITVIYTNSKGTSIPSVPISVEQDISIKEINNTITIDTSAPGGSYLYSLVTRQSQTANTTHSDGFTIKLPGADAPDTNANTNTTPDPTTVIPGKITDPFAGKSLLGVVTQVINILLALIVIAAVVVVVIAGFQILTGGSNPSQLAKARRAITWAIIGLAVAFMSFGIVQIIQKILQK